MEIKTETTRNPVIFPSKPEKPVKTPDELKKSTVRDTVKQQAEAKENKKVEDVVQALEGSLEKMKGVLRSDLKFEIVREAEIVVVKIVNKENGEVVRQIPPEEIVKLLTHLNEVLGVLFDERA